RPHRAVRDLRGGDAVAVVAASPVGAPGVGIGEAHAVAVLRDLLAAAPVAEEMARGRIADARRLLALDLPRDALRRGVAVARAQRVHVVLLLHPGGDHAVAVREGLAEHLLGALPRVVVGDSGGASRQPQHRRGAGERPHRLSPGARISPPFAYFAMNTS